jgi:anthraniloyl-CoA monooxygenase
MRITCVGGGPGGLYFAVLMKKADPRHQIRVVERNRPDDTFGFGVVFSDATMAGIADADSEAYQELARHLVHWDDIEVHYRRQQITSTGHGFSGMSRHTLLRVLQEQACSAGVELLFEHDISTLEEWRDADLLVAADGSNSPVRRLLGDSISTTIDLRPNRFVWLGTTSRFQHSRSTSSTTLTGYGACTRTNTVPTTRRSSSNAASRRGRPPEWTARPSRKRRRSSSGCSRPSSTATR